MQKTNRKTKTNKYNDNQCSLSRKGWWIVMAKTANVECNCETLVIMELGPKISAHECQPLWCFDAGSLGFDIKGLKTELEVNSFVPK